MNNRFIIKILPPAIFIFVSFFAFSLKADDTTKLKWDTSEGKIYVYSVEIGREKDGKITFSSTKEKICIPACKISVENIHCSLNELYKKIFFIVPEFEAKEGNRYTTKFDFKDSIGREFKIIFNTKILEITTSENEETVKFESVYTIKEVKSPASSYKFISGKIEVTNVFNATKKFLVESEVKSEIKEQINKSVQEYKNIERYRYLKIENTNDSNLRKRIREAIEKGVNFLKSTQNKDGSWGKDILGYKDGETALCLLALLRSGVKSDDPVIKKGFEWLNKQPFRKTYSVSLFIMATEAKYIPKSEIENSEKYLEGDEAIKIERRDVSKTDLDRIKDGVEWLLKNSNNRETWSYPTNITATYDHSNTQYAILGLDSASRCGITIDNQVWKGILRHFLSTQEKKGKDFELEFEKSEPGKKKTTVVKKCKVRGWDYISGEKAYGSMTCAGISCVALSRYWLITQKAMNKKLKKDSEAAINDGLAWLTENYHIIQNPKHSGWYEYYLYSLERACVLTGNRFLGKHDWYYEGAICLLNTQKSDGSWGGYVETSFILLFLKKATPPAITGSGD